MSPQEREVLEQENRELNTSFAEMKRTHKKLIGIPTFSSKEDWESFKGIVQKGFDGATLTGKQRNFLRKVISDSLNIAVHAKTPGGLLDNCVFQSYRKYASQLAVPGVMSVLDTYNIGLTADMAADMNWMRVFRTLDMRGTLAGKITNFFLHATIRELKPQEAVPYTYIGVDTEEDVERGRVGGGFAFDKQWLKMNGFIQMNDAMMALREENDIIKSRDAYAQLISAIPASEAFVTDLQTTFNNGYFNLLDPLRANKGYGITASAQVLAFYNPIHAQAVTNAMFARRGAANDTNEVIHNIVPIPTFDVPAQLQENGAGPALDAVLFVLPGRRILHLPQDDLSEMSAFEWEKNIWKTGLQDWYKNEVKDAAQTRRILMS